jgi:hypothetical protein
MFFKNGRGALCVCIWNKGGGGPKSFWNHCLKGTFINVFVTDPHGAYPEQSVSRPKLHIQFLQDSNNFTIPSVYNKVSQMVSCPQFSRHSTKILQPSQACYMPLQPNYKYKLSLFSVCSYSQSYRPFDPNSFLKHSLACTPAFNSCPQLSVRTQLYVHKNHDLNSVVYNSISRVWGWNTKVWTQWQQAFSEFSLLEIIWLDPFFYLKTTNGIVGSAHITQQQKVFDNRNVERGHWPPRSQDLIPPDFVFQGFLKKDSTAITQ